MEMRFQPQETAKGAPLEITTTEGLDALELETPKFADRATKPPT